ncbi:hypothetical protein [Candidatus Viadribacter manganicus]|uniref:DUF4760 domain-containing protein n=1 Tax=Candidatus Viadribacter manganicus TaxID=1759059 RepID=A0A1B1AFQ9_9PROT|nr:hypothetical protein [Candidatus Viadribacter manganicus]ANP45393.1 hypothetical protein ATE48_05415 [Candidatus Viadribacter manganicus]
MRIEFSPEWLTLIVTLVGAAIAVQTIREATRNSRLEKFAGVLMECTRRYGDLIELRHALNKDVQCADTTTQSASRRSYGDWFLERLGALSRDNDSFGGAFERGWTEIGRRPMVTHPAFAAFVDAVWAFKGRPPADARGQIDHLISTAFKKGRPMRISFVRKSLSRSA